MRAERPMSVKSLFSRVGATVLSLVSLSVVFLGGVATGVFAGTRAWRDGCIVEVNVGAKFLKSDCSARRRDGTLVEFVKPMEPLTLLAALQRVAGMTESKDPERIFIDRSLESADFAEKIVTPPEGRQGSLAVIRQLLVDADASGRVDICLVQGGYRIQLQSPRGATQMPQERQ